MAPEEIEELVRRLYAALEAGDAAAVDELLAPDFDGQLAEGMPLGLGGPKRGAAAMRDDGWWAIGRAFAARAEPDEWVRCADGRLLVLGRYRGRARQSGGALDAAFAHVWTAAGGRLTALRHFTDTARWTDALAETP
jgi:2-(1,2-epoxy-1,2-dihydrophenyl)acetyl-CoA isomerase